MDGLKLIMNDPDAKNLLREVATFNTLFLITGKKFYKRHLEIQQSIIREKFYIILDFRIHCYCFLTSEPAMSFPYRIICEKYTGEVK
jgi:hypothetical protein